MPANVVARASLADRSQRLETAIQSLSKLMDEGTATVLQNKMQDLLEQVVHVGRCANQVQRQAMGLRMVPIGPVLKRFHRVVRDVCRHTGNEAELQLQGEGVEIDKQLVDELLTPHPSCAQCGRPRP